MGKELEDEEMDDDRISGYDDDDEPDNDENDEQEEEY